MQPTTQRRALLLFALFLAFGTSLVSVRAYLLQPHTTAPAASPTLCPRYTSHPSDLIIVLPSPVLRDDNTLSLDIPGPILVFPPPCPAP